MRSIILAIFFLAVSLTPLSGQIAYYSAKILSDSFVIRKNSSFEFKSDAVSRLRICGLLKDFLSEPMRNDTYLNIGFVLDRYSNNPFLDIQIHELTVAKSEGNDVATPLESFSPSSARGISVANFADGLARFLVKRFKEELTITFFQKFKSTIDKSPEMQTLFPQTYKVLLAINTDIYQFSSYLNTLREGFIKDLSNLYLHLNDFSNLKKYHPYFEKHPALFTSIQSAFYLIDQYAAGTHPGEALEHYDTSMLRFKDITVQYNVRSIISVVQAVSGSFRSVSPGHFWVPADSLQMLLEDRVSRDIYFGLICQKYGGITFRKPSGEEKRLDKLLAEEKYEMDSSMRAYRNYLGSFAMHTDEVSEYVSELRAKKKSEIDYNDYYKLYNSSLDLLDQACSFLDLPAVDALLNAQLKNEINSKVYSFLFTARSVGELYVDIRTKNYSSAILNASGIIDTMLSGYNDRYYVDSLARRTALLRGEFESQIDDGKEKRRVKKIVRDFSATPALTYDSLRRRLEREGIVNSAGAYIDSFINTSRLLNETGSEKKLSYSILKYGTFAASVAQAQNSAQVEDAIESVALPSGSSRIKREATLNIALNAYLGGFGGWEYLPALKQNQTSMSAGLTAPVGIAYSFGGIGKRKGDMKSGKSLTIFVPVIDVGALAAFRFGNDSSEVASEVQFKNIIAPGLFLFVGLGKCPLSIGAGVQVGPQLRKISVKNPDDMNIDKNFYVRYGLTIAVDIPVFNFYTKTR